MFTILVIGVLGWFLVAVLVGGLCAMAAEGDRALLLPAAPEMDERLVLPTEPLRLPVLRTSTPEPGPPSHPVPEVD